MVHKQLFIHYLDRFLIMFLWIQKLLNWVNRTDLIVFVVSINNFTSILEILITTAFCISDKNNKMF